MKSWSVPLASALAAMLLPACTTVEPAGSDAAVATLRGSVVYREKVALPADAQVRVQLVDAAQPSARVVVAENTFGTAGRQVPIEFALPFDPTKLEAGHAYALRAYILVDGNVRYVTAARVNVDSAALPASVTILLKAGTADPVVTDSPAPQGATRRPPPGIVPQRGSPPPGKR